MSKKKEQSSSDEGINSFPSETLPYCRSLVAQIVKRKGDTLVSFKDIAIILGKSRGALILPVSSCQQYNLLQNIHGKGYKVTELFHKMETPVYEIDRQKAILEALNSAPLYNILINEFNGKVLPDEQGMAHYLVRKFAVKAYILNKVVNVFFKNFRDLQLIDSNNRLRFLLPDSTDSLNEKLIIDTNKGTQDENNNSGDIQNNESTPPLLLPDKKMFKQSIDIGEDGTAILEYPRKISASGVEALRIHLEATLKALEVRIKINTKKEEDE